MPNLIKNEFFKFLHSKKIYIFAIIIAVFTIITNVGLKVSGTYLAIANVSIIGLQMLGVMTSFLLPVFSIILIADMITEEYSDGTLKLSMLTPHTRAKIFASKFITIVIFSFAIMIFTFIISYFIGFIFFSIFMKNSAITVESVFPLFKSFILSVLPILSFDLIVFFLALILPSNGSTIGASIGLFFAMQIAGGTITSIKDYLITNYFGIFSGDKIPSDLLTKSIIVIGVYGIVFYLLSHYVFKNKDILK